ncbi:DUF4328 domain-containing protein [Sphingomonas carotinifaciens]|uniref:DUF4328 domain-containing protein n=1 Tax=Sphingomonas carotinifaciens TaxID=1166323 RepID=UPI0039A16516
MLRDPTPLARRAIVLVWIWFATDCLVALESVWEISVLSGVNSDASADQVLGDGADPAVITGLAYLLGIITSGWMVLRWVYVVNRNAHHWSDAMTIGPKWNVGWFFVPIAGLWMPFAGLRQSRGATIDPQHPDRVPVPAWMRLWWGLWITSLMLGNFAGRLAFAADTAGEMTAANWLYVLSIPIDLPLTILLCHLIREVSAMQQARIADMASMAPEGPAHTSHR